MEYDKLKYLTHIYTFDRKIINFVTLLSVFYFIFLIVEFRLETFENMLGILIFIDTVICLIFISEFLYLYARARDKKEYFRKYFLDILSSIPLMSLALFWPELLLLNIFKLLRGAKGLLKIYDFIIEDMKTPKHDTKYNIKYNINAVSAKSIFAKAQTKLNKAQTASAKAVSKK